MWYKKIIIGICIVLLVCFILMPNVKADFPEKIDFGVYKDGHKYTVYEHQIVVNSGKVYHDCCVFVDNNHVIFCKNASGYFISTNGCEFHLIEGNDFIPVKHYTNLNKDIENQLKKR